MFKKSQLFFSPHLLSCLSFHLPHLLPFQLPVFLLSCCNYSPHKVTHSHALAFNSPHTAANYGVNRSISRKSRGRQRVNRQDSLREVEGTKEAMRGGEEEGRGHLIEMEIEQAN